MNPVTRREFLHSIASASVATVGCSPKKQDAMAPEAGRALLKSRPRTPTKKPATGLHRLGLLEVRDGLIYVPPSYSPARSSPLLLMLHGAGQDSRSWARVPLPDLLDKGAIVAVIPDSRFETWDMIHGDYGPDVEFIDRALALAFRTCSIDPRRIGIAGFSDGATYALSLGITNPDLFSSIIAFSPGLVRPAAVRGKPRIFIAHGTEDEILPIDITSREIVAALKEQGYPVRYEEFEGPHTMRMEDARHAIDWFLQG